MERIGHYIGGKVVLGESGRTGPVFDPATGAQTHEVDLASADEVDRAVQAAAEAFPAWRATSLAKRAEIMFRLRELVDLHRADIAKILTAQHGKVLSDAMGEVARGLENIEFACGVPNLLKGGFSEQVSTGRRRLLDPAAARRGRGDHPVQLPGDGAHVDVRERDRVREHVRAEAVGEGPGRVALHRRAAEGSGPSRRRLQRRAGRQGGGRRDPGAPDDRGGELRRFHADRAVHLRDGDAQREARAGARRREEPHDRPAGRGHRHGGRRRRLRRVRLGRRAVHGHLGDRRGRRRRRSARRRDPGAAPEGEGRPRATIRSPRWARS